MTIHLFQLILTTTVLLTTASTAAHRSAYGEPCSRTVKCDRRAFLACTPEGQCDCTRPDEMFYEPATQKCVSRAGEACKFMREGLDDNNNILYEVTACVTNAICGPDGFCSCSSRYFENSNGSCTPAQSHGEPCNNADQKCSRFEALHCSQNGDCQCDEKKAVYYKSKILNDITQSQCVGLAGHPCINGFCTDGASCLGDFCVCNPETFRSPLDRCRSKVPIHGNCTDHRQCLMDHEEQLTCENGKCVCNSGYAQFGKAQKHRNSHRRYTQQFHSFEPEEFIQCLGLAESPCLDRLCVPRAYCQYNHDRESGTCKCQPGYTKSASGNCGHGPGEGCDSAESCVDGLVCKSKVCACLYDNQEFDIESQSCVSKIGGPCQIGRLPINCVKNAECLYSSSMDESGHCSCKRGHVENSEGTCDMAFGSRCSSAEMVTVCDQVAGLVCLNNFCRCGGFALFNEKLRKCVGLVGAKCELGDGNGKVEEDCVQGAKCAKIHAKLGGRCICQSGFNETDDYTCVESIDRTKRNHGNKDKAISSGEDSKQIESLIQSFGPDDKQAVVVKGRDNNLAGFWPMSREDQFEGSAAQAEEAYGIF